MVKRDVIILGGGIAGISAAVRLLRHGIKATLVEQRPFLGGRAFSFVDRASGEEIDNGQHVILGVCNEFLQLLTELGTRNQIELGPSLDVLVSHDGKLATLRAGSVFGNASALIGYTHLNFPDRLSVARILVKLKLNVGGIGRKTEMSNGSFAEWLLSQHQSRTTVDRFWSLFILPVFNCRVDEVTAQDAIEFIRTALLGRSSDTAIGYPLVGLSSLIGTPASRFLRAEGVELMMNSRVASISGSHDEGFKIASSANGIIHCEKIVSALAPLAMARILPPSDGRFAAMKNALMDFEYSPIVAVHLWFAKPVMSEPVVAFVDRGLQWVFNDSVIRNTANAETQHIVVSLSGAEEWAALEKNEILDRVISSMRAAFPMAKTTEVINAAVVKTLDATVKVNCGSRQLRIGPSTEVPGFFVAGDWTDTGLPATMEGAVRSGNAAADLVASQLGVASRPMEVLN